MCDRIIKTFGTEAVGYKVVVTDKYGHHYSPFTGVRYKPGPVPKWDYVTSKPLKHKANHNLIYNATHESLCLTALFDTEDEAVRVAYIIAPKGNLPYGCSRNVVEMTLTGDIYTGYMDHTKCVLGNTIKSIKVLKEYKNN